MKTALIAIGLLASTATTVAFYPSGTSLIGHGTEINVTAGGELASVNPLTLQRPQIEVVFVLDTTSSMGGLIEAAKEKIWSIATTMASAQPAPEIKMGLVAYRDRGDSYITRVVDLSTDLDSMYATLMDFQPVGGGDGPESVNQALADAVQKISWSENSNAYKVVFLVGDAPAHMDYQNDVKFPVSIAAAKNKGIVVNAIRCGTDPHTQQQWQHIAELSGGRYFDVNESGDAVVIATPFDKELAILSEELDKTRIYYGSAKEKAKQALKVDASRKLHKSSSLASRARRATFNASETGAGNFLGENELVDDIASGRIEFSAVAPESLPAALQSMAPAEREAAVKESAERRNDLRAQVQRLAQQRKDYVKKEIDAVGGAASSLDDKIYSVVREQAEQKGMRYESDTPDY
ncbi:MAG: VWA domain-containing protein [Gammaproteobacteria bacterium]|nr:VWA domain-containing protein [Gammaproteobacteria bacterium]MDH3466730.1 VWA domain-containing protein [Gammaproteobacteria bacterium]